MQTNAASQTPAVEGEPLPVSGATSQPEPAGLYDGAVAASPADEVILHVRFRPDTTVWEIAETPDHLSKQDWFHLLCARVPSKFHTRAGGRGFFTLTRTELAALKVRNAN